MTDELPEKYRDTSRYKVLDGGAIYGFAEGKIVAHLFKGGGRYQFTKENAGAMNERARILGRIAHFRALAKSAGIEVPEDADLEELAKAAANGVELLTLHMLTTFKSSKNLRGMAESFGKLTAGFVEPERGPVDPDRPIEVNLLALIRQYTLAAGETIEGKIIEDEKGD